MASFRYTADGSVFRPSLAALGVLIVVEVPVLGFIAHLVIPGAGGVAVETAIGSVSLAFLLILASPLFTRHSIEAGTLRVRYGVLVAADIPLADIAGARPVRLPVGLLQPLGASIDENRAAVLFGEHGQVELALRRPAPIRAGFARGQVDRLTVSVDDPEALMSAVSPGPG
jgi:hypothetical protein